MPQEAPQQAETEEELFRIIHIAYQFRLYPENEQHTFLAKAFGCQRFIYNYFLSRRIYEWENNKRGLYKKACELELTQLKKEEDLLWLNEMNSQSLQAAIQNLDTAFINFFEKRAEFPKYKKKSNRQSVKIKQNFCVENGLLYIPKLKTGIKINQHREMEGKPISCTISKTPCGDYYVSIICEVKKELKPAAPMQVSREQIRGYDAGLSALLTAKDGELIDNKRFYKSSEKDIAYLNRQLSKKKRGGRNYEKARIKLAKLHEYVANCRKELDRIYPSIFFREQGL